jgi:hypothetical protein
MPLEPAAGCLIDGLGQLVTEMGGEAIRKRYGWKGCIIALIPVFAIIGFSWWYLTR